MGRSGPGTLPYSLASQDKAMVPSALAVSLL